jgi:hypothetical protein
MSMDTEIPGSPTPPLPQPKIADSARINSAPTCRASVFITLLLEHESPAKVTSNLPVDEKHGGHLD